MDAIAATAASEDTVRPPRLLVVDDDPDNLELLCRIFRREECEVFSAATGAEALRLVAEVKPDLVLLDVILPDLNGRDVCRAIKANPVLADVFVALISSIEISSERKVAGLACGADEYIARPIANAELVARVEALYRIQRAITARRIAETRLAHLNRTLEERVLERTAELAWANEHLQDEMARRVQAQARSEAFARLGEQLSATATPLAAAEVILETAGQLLGWDAGFLQLYAPETGQFTPVLAFDTKDGARVDATASIRRTRPSPQMRRVIREGGQLILRKPSEQPARGFGPFGNVARASASLLFVPIRHGGAVAGIVSIQSYTPDHYTPASLETLQALADHCGGALDRLSAEAARHASDTRFSAFMEHAPVFAWIKDERFRYVYMNPRARQFLGLAAGLAHSKTDFELFPQAHARRIRANDEAALAGGSSSELMEDLTKSGGEPRYCWVLRFPLHDAAGRRLLAGMSVDITEKVRADAALRALPHRIIEAQEGERRRVARELHDGVSQLLASVRFRLSSVEGWLHERADDQLRRDMTRAKAHLDAATREVRAISHNLRPRELDDLGLVAALRSAAADLAEHSGWHVEFRLARLRKRLPADVELAFYRIFQEALANILKHAKATRIQIELFRERTGVTLRITDDGTGFATPRRQHRSARASLGLVNMRERAEFISGTLTVKSVPHEGVVIEVWAPVARRVRNK